MVSFDFAQKDFSSSVAIVVVPFSSCRGHSCSEPVNVQDEPLSSRGPDPQKRKLSMSSAPATVRRQGSFHQLSLCSSCRGPSPNKLSGVDRELSSRGPDLKKRKLSMSSAPAKTHADKDLFVNCHLGRCPPAPRCRDTAAGINIEFIQLLIAHSISVHCKVQARIQHYGQGGPDSTTGHQQGAVCFLCQSKGVGPRILVGGSLRVNPKTPQKRDQNWEGEAKELKVAQNPISTGPN